MQLQYLTLSFSHKSTPIALREKLALPQDKLAHFITLLKAKTPSLHELVLLNTCNRVEFYICTHAPQECISAILSAFATYINLPLHTLESHCQSALGAEAVHHIFSVASGLDSIVLGETQIVGQMKDAYKLCFELQACAQEMTRLMHFAFKSAAKVRTQTAIAKSPTSTASVCVKKALESNPKRALILGAGEIGQLVARHLLDSGVAVCMSNRTKAKALACATTLLQERKIAHIIDINAYEATHSTQDSACFSVLDWSLVEQCVNDFELVFSATSAPNCIITSVEDRNFPRMWFDLAVPRDISPEIQAHNLQVFCIDDLEQVIEHNRTQKKAQAQQAYALVGAAVGEYFHWLQSLDVLPLIKSMRQLAKEASIQEVTRAIKKGYLPQEQEEEVLRILHNAFNVFLHNPTLLLKEFSHHKEGDIIIQSLQKIFTQSTTPKLLDRYKCEYEL